MLNARAILRGDRTELCLVMELMGMSAEELRQRIGKLPHTCVVQLAQHVFHKHYRGPSAAIGKGACPGDLNVDRQTPVPEIILALIAHDVLSGLEALHEGCGVVHGDLKPANILLSKDRTTFKIGDFGCVYRLGSDRTATHCGDGLGSKAYKAPERLTDDGASPCVFGGNADVWSLGITLLELANGAHPCEPFLSDYWNYKSRLQLKNMLTPLSYSKSFERFIVRCLDPQPKHRASPKQLLSHPFISNCVNIDRELLQKFIGALLSEESSYHKKSQLDLLRKSLLCGTRTGDRHMLESQRKWRKYNSRLSPHPSVADEVLFPPLS
jgi:serine/threonine protein kinase